MTLTKHTSTQLFSLLLTLWLSMLGLHVQAQSVIHHGPSLDVQVQRGNVRLPMALVSQLRKGDKLLVRPDPETLTKDGWVLLLARVSLTGTQVESKYFEVKDLKEPAELDIKADNQVTVIMLAPQLRNLFGLYTSLSESAGLLNDVLRADPQRFYELQKVDQINQAIQVISQGLIQRMAGSQGQESLQAAKDLAAKFGVTTIDPQCVNKDVVNTECLATQIVINKDFSLPTDSELNAMMGKKAGDLNSFLLSNVRMFSEASDYLSNKYRDNYDFAPTFGRRQAGTSRIDLYSIARFRSGNVKTAYIYSPSWFSGNAPRLQVAAQKPACYTRGEVSLQMQGKLPLMNYWHSWQMTVSDPATQQNWGDVTGLAFDPDSGRLHFDPLSVVMVSPNQNHEVSVRLRGQFGFDPVTFEPFRMRLPTQDPNAIAQAVSGQSDLISGEKADLMVRESAGLACFKSMALQLDNRTMVRSDAGPPGKLSVDLQQVQSGTANLVVQQVGAPAVTVPLRIMPPKAHVMRIEHAQADDTLTVTGNQLNRIAHIELAGLACAPSSPIKPTGSVMFKCEGDIRDNATLPAQALVVHVQNEPAAQRVALTKTAIQPRIAISNSSPNAVLVSPSPKALQWGLTPNDAYMTEDSGLTLLLQAQAPYALTRGSYTLELRFTGDAALESKPLSVSLIADLAHNELRTRNPVNFTQTELPSVVNALEYRVVHSPSGLSSVWQPLPRQVVLLPELQAAWCSPQGDAWWIPGKRLDLMDGVRWADAGADFQPAQLVSCPKGLCLSLPQSVGPEGFEMRMRWVDDRIFKAKVPATGSGCTGN
jgi:hypothetical protein